MTKVTYSLGPKRPLRPEEALVDRLKRTVESVDPSIDVIIYSGRQQANRQYGSPRHSTGFTADFYLERGGKRLQTGDPVHRKIWATLPRFGLTEIGVGMANGGMHAGFGSDDPNIKPGKRRPPLAWGYPGGSVSRLNEKYPDYVKALQATLGLKVDGVFGDKTRTALAAIADDNPAPATAFAATPEAVRDRLADLGFEGDTAVQDFQKANNLTVDGIIGPQTINAAQAPNVVRGDGSKQSPSLFGRAPLVDDEEIAPKPPAETRTNPVKPPGSAGPDPGAAATRKRMKSLGLDGNNAIEKFQKADRPKIDGAIGAKTIPASGRVTPSKSIVAEIEEIQEKMRSDRLGYFADEALQSRYRELIATRERTRRHRA